jgi:hypothetical protein
MKVTGRPNSVAWRKRRLTVWPLIQQYPDFLTVVGNEEGFSVDRDLIGTHTGPVVPVDSLNRLAAFWWHVTIRKSRLSDSSGSEFAHSQM